jgi:pimeloyl-ACP methyl ester carboxylesterase
MPPLSGEHRVIALDLKGFGLSDKPLDACYSVRDQSAIVAAFIGEKNLTELTLVGHSFGGAVALLTCLGMEEGNEAAVSGMILIACASYRQKLPYFIQLPRIPLVNRLALAFLPRKAKAEMVLRTAFYDDSKITEEMVETYASYLDHPGAHHALITTAKQILPPDVGVVTARYREIRIPVLVIWGDRDVITPLGVGQRLVRELPRGALRIIQDCGHMPQEEAPEETLRLFLGFLRESNAVNFRDSNGGG